MSAVPTPSGVEHEAVDDTKAALDQASVGGSTVGRLEGRSLAVVRRRWPLRSLAVVLAVGGLLATSASGATVTDLGLFVPDGLNSHGVVVGDIINLQDPNSVPHAASWTNGTLTPLPERAGTTSSHAFAVSETGRVVGLEYDVATLEVHAVYWDGVAGPTQVGPLAAGQDFSQAEDVDAAGDVVGSTPGAAPHSFVGYYAAAGGSPIPVGVGDLDPDKGISSVGAISADGTTLLGRVQGTTAADGYYLWSSASPAAAGTKLDLTPNRSGFGVLVGASQSKLIQNNLASDGSVLGFKGTAASKTWYLRAPDGSETPIVGLTAANAINAKHVVAGIIATGNPSDPGHAAIWDAATQTVTDLNTLLPADSGFVLINAFAINDNGDIVGYAAHNNADVGFLLSADTCSLSGPSGGQRLGSTTRAAGCALSVDWKMPRRINPGPFSTKDGVAPAEEVYPPGGWTVQLYLRDGGQELTSCPADKIYRWSVRLRDPSKPKQKPIVVPGTGCREFIQVDREGVYLVSVEERNKSDNALTGRKDTNHTVVVQDWLIVGIGDSNGSGQGTAIARVPYDFPQCDRSDNSYQALAAKAVEDADERSAVTFLHAACSGAVAAHLTKQSYEGQEADPKNKLVPQLKQIRDRLKAGRPRREIDAVILSIGVNNLAFGSVAKICLLSHVDVNPLYPPRCADFNVFLRIVHGEPLLDLSPNLTVGSGSTMEMVVNNLVQRLPREYAMVSHALAAMKIRPNRVYITTYPDFTTDELGNRCDVDKGDASATPGLLETEWNFLKATASKLNGAIAATHQAHHWSPVTGIPARFAGVGFGHGYCAGNGQRWIQTLAGSAVDQINQYGALHSLRPGHQAMAEEVAKVMCPQMYGTDDCTGALPREPGTTKPDPM